MKKLIGPVFLLAFLQFPGQHRSQNPSPLQFPVAGNVFVITVDGFRWQEVFTGADPELIGNTRYTPDTSGMKQMYWDEDPDVRRKKLLPFFWNVMAVRGQLFGNRLLGNKSNVANPYAISYPGYNEILTGVTDPAIASNRKVSNPNVNVLEYINEQPAFKGRVAVFSSWDVFPFIVNTQRNDVFVNSGYQQANGDRLSAAELMINKVQQSAVYEKTATRYDQLTFLAAKEYMMKYSPRLVFLGLGETDEFAHAGRYDLYLNHASQIDRMIGELWNWVQTTPGYRDNTTFIITTDHGRGNRDHKWVAHGQFIRGSSETWLAVIGPSIPPLGELKDEGQIYQQQLASTIAQMLGETFTPQHDAVTTISLR